MALCATSLEYCLSFSFRLPSDRYAVLGAAVLLLMSPLLAGRLSIKFRGRHLREQRRTDQRLSCRSEHVNQAKVELNALGEVSRSSLKIGIEENGEIALSSSSIDVHQTRADPEDPGLGTM
jgi:hypothetical protein